MSIIIIQLRPIPAVAIAGLLQETIRDSLQKFPLLGDIPILGTLFRSRSFQKNETELIIVVTPRLVKPLELAKQSLPTDYYVEPNDVELFLEGRMQGRAKNNPFSAHGDLDGEFGHAVPKQTN